MLERVAALVENRRERRWREVLRSAIERVASGRWEGLAEKRWAAGLVLHPPTPGVGGR